jgi:hypothetical protein
MENKKLIVAFIILLAAMLLIPAGTLVYHHAMYDVKEYPDHDRWAVINVAFEPEIVDVSRVERRPDNWVIVETTDGTVYQSGNENIVILDKNPNG